MDKTLKRQVVMVDKNFDKITYEDKNGNVKGTFQTFTFESDGANGPYNEGYDQNLISKREMETEKIPDIGSRQPLKIEQDKTSVDGDPVKIAFTTLQTRQDQYGMLFAIQFLNGTEKAIYSYSVFTSDGSVDTQQSIKTLGGITLNGITYEYFLAKIAPDSQGRTETTVQIDFYAQLLTNGKMVLKIYEGFTFNNFSGRDYISADLTTHTPYPHQEDFDKHKFRDVMIGNVLLAGTQRADGTVKADESLRLGSVNLRGAIPYRYTVVLPFVSPAASSGTGGWTNVYPKPPDYPVPVFPVIGTGQVIIALLTHNFDNDSAIPSPFTLEYRLLVYKESQSSTTKHSLGSVTYTSSKFKRSINCFSLNKSFTYDPPSDCIGLGIQFKQTPYHVNTAIGSESRLFLSVEQMAT